MGFPQAINGLSMCLRSSSRDVYNWLFTVVFPRKLASAEQDNTYFEDSFSALMKFTFENNNIHYINLRESFRNLHFLRSNSFTNHPELYNSRTIGGLSPNRDLAKNLIKNCLKNGQAMDLTQPLGQVKYPLNKP